mgnify:CR=1 FL=1
MVDNEFVTFLQMIRTDKNLSSKHVMCLPPPFIIWAGVCSYGKTLLKIIDKGVKSNFRSLNQQGVQAFSEK